MMHRIESSTSYVNLDDDQLLASESNPDLSKLFITVPESTLGPVANLTAATESIPTSDPLSVLSAPNTIRMTLTPLSPDEAPPSGSNVLDAPGPISAYEQRTFAWIFKPSSTETHDRSTASIPPVKLAMICEKASRFEELIVKYLGKSALPSHSAVPPNLRGNEEVLKWLISVGELRAAIDFTGKILAKHFERTKQHQFTPENLKLMFRIGEFAAAATEMDQMGDLDRHEFRFCYYPNIYGSRKGSMVPFTLRLLHAECPRFVDHPADVIPRLNHVLSVTNRILENLNAFSREDVTYDAYANEDKAFSIQLWTERRSRIIEVLARTCFAMKDYHSAVLAYEQLEKFSPDTTVEESLGKVCLHAGDGRSATRWFHKSCSGDGADSRSHDQNLLLSGLLEIFQGNYTLAAEKFTSLARANKNNNAAANNAAVALLYCGKIIEATAMLEKLIESNPAAVRFPGVCTNLSSLYELHYSKSTAKEVELVRVVRDHYLETFDSLCIKL